MKTALKKEFGNPEINELIAYFKMKFDLPIMDDSTFNNRRFCRLSLVKFGGVDKVKMVIDAAANDPFWSTHMASFRALYYKAVQIISATRGKKFDISTL